MKKIISKLKNIHTFLLHWFLRAKFEEKKTYNFIKISIFIHPLENKNKKSKIKI